MPANTQCSKHLQVCPRLLVWEHEGSTPEPNTLCTPATASLEHFRASSFLAVCKFCRPSTYARHEDGKTWENKVRATEGRQQTTWGSKLVLARTPGKTTARLIHLGALPGDQRGFQRVNLCTDTHDIHMIYT